MTRFGEYNASARLRLHSFFGEHNDKDKDDEVVSHLRDRDPSFLSLLFAGDVVCTVAVTIFLGLFHSPTFLDLCERSSGAVRLLHGSELRC